MKKLVLIFGIISALIISSGVALKFFEIGGGCLLIIISILFVYTYLILLGIQKVKETQGIGKVMQIFKYVSFSVLYLGIVYYLNHYIGANFIFLSGCVIYLVYLILKFLYQKAKKPEENALNKIIPSLIIIILILALANTNNDKFFNSSISLNNFQTKASIKAVDTSIQRLMSDFEINRSQFPVQLYPKYLEAQKINALCDSLVGMIENCKKTAVLLTSGEKIGSFDTIALNDLKSKNCSKSTSIYFNNNDENGIAYEIHKQIQEINDTIKSLLPENYQYYLIPVSFGQFYDKKTLNQENWEKRNFYYSDLINNLAYLDNLILAVRITQKEFISLMLLEARSEAMWTFWRKYKEMYPDRNTK